MEKVMDAAQEYGVEALGPPQALRSEAERILNGAPLPEENDR
jgi:hypothetical protein